MALEIMQDPRVRSVEWRDLMPLTVWEVTHEVLISLPWIALALFFYHVSFAWEQPALIVPGLAAAFFFFLTGLRQTHNAFHYAVGISRLGCEIMMFVLSVLMMGSMHAVQVNHLHHHKHCMDEDDMEAMSARMPGWRAIMLGPVFPWKLHVRAFELAPWRVKKWIVADLIANAIWIALVFGVFDVMALKVHVVVMTLGQCFTAFFAVWTVHHDCDRSHFIGRTIRGKLKSLLTYNMFYHVEHHLFPSVPTCHLHLLAERLDEAAPELKQKAVF